MLHKDPCLAVFGRFAYNYDEAEQMHDDINRALSSGHCSDRAAECFRLYFYQGLTLAEIGKLLGITKSTASRHVKAATMTCRVLLHQVDYYLTK